MFCDAGREVRGFEGPCFGVGAEGRARAWTGTFGTRAALGHPMDVLRATVAPLRAKAGILAGSLKLRERLQ